MPERITSETVGAILDIAKDASALSPRPGPVMCAKALADFRESVVAGRLTFERGAQTSYAIEMALKWLIEERLRKSYPVQEADPSTRKTGPNAWRGKDA